ncbi:unnamed protein product [Thelazia callipaeda]|uniref:Neur_chan_LBD domain-containing protein n=1 Tax=Thelazia callipaeda TaxID=103827 RepID=A0A0N5CT46_THECL|nr:unnamed protein product [Thelazia callipaeda]
MNFEKAYVWDVYKRLASLPNAKDQHQTTRRSLPWVNVQKFVSQLPLGTIAIDIGEFSLSYTTLITNSEYRIEISVVFMIIISLIIK